MTASLYCPLTPCQERQTWGDRERQMQRERQSKLGLSVSVFLQDMCVVCGSFGRGAEGHLLACSQCSQCYHPYCVNSKVSSGPQTCRLWAGPVFTPLLPHSCHAVFLMFYYTYLSGVGGGVRGQPCGFQGPNTDYQAWWQGPVCAEPPA